VPSLNNALGWLRQAYSRARELGDTATMAELEELGKRAEALYKRLLHPVDAAEE